MDWVCLVQGVEIIFKYKSGIKQILKDHKLFFDSHY